MFLGKPYSGKTLLAESLSKYQQQQLHQRLTVLSAKTIVERALAAYEKRCKVSDETGEME